jgi:hypothetical protein
MDGYIYGLDEFYYGDELVGNIDENGLQSGGDAPQTLQIRAAQLRNAVVKTIAQQPGTNRFTFTLIDLKKENLPVVFGGTVAGGVYSAPRESVQMTKRAFIKCFSGHKINIPKATLTSNLAGGINLAGVLSIGCTLDIEIPDTEAPFSIYDPGEVVPDDPSEAA